MGTALLDFSNTSTQSLPPPPPPPQEDEGCHYPLNTFGGCVYGRAKKQSDQNISQHWQYLYYFNSLDIRAFAVLLPSAS